MSTGTLAGKTALVTGAARNIGKAIALALAEDGANVVVNAVQDKQAADAVAGEVEAAGGSALVHLADITDRAAVDDMAAAAKDRFGGVDILILNASTRGQSPFLEMSHDDFRKVIDISLDGAFFLAQACIPSMVERGWGRIVGLGGISWHIGTTNRVHNLAGKAGLTGLVRGLATEFATSGITANCISPGFIDTVRPASAGARPKLQVNIPVDRLGHPDEIAATARFLCQPSAAYVTGQTVHVNGGLYLG